MLKASISALLPLALLGSAAMAGADPLPSQGSETGVVIPLSQRQQIRSRINGIDYRLSIFLPKGYHDTQDRYPVFYFIDGEIFGPTIAITSRILADDMPKIIVVGVDTADDEDFHFMDLPSAGHDPHWDVPANRGAANFLRVMLEEIKPRIDASFRTDAADAGIGGHSLGGFFALYALLHAPDRFRHVYAASPSFIWQDHVLLRDEAALAQHARDLPARVFVDQGGLEDQTSDLADLTGAITGRAYPSLRWHARIASGQTHRTIVYADAVDALYAIYGPELRRPEDAELAALAGSYKLADGKRFSLQADDGQLFIAGFRSLEHAELQSSEPGKWFIRYLNYRMDVDSSATDGPALTFHLQPTPGPNGEVSRPVLTAVRDRPAP